MNICRNFVATVALMIGLCGCVSQQADRSQETSAKPALAGLKCQEDEKIQYMDLLQSYHAILVGEVHGTNEMPVEFLSLVTQASHLRSNAKIVVALEYSSDWQEKIDFVLSQKTSEDMLEALDFLNTRDGRSSMAMKKILIGLAELKTSGANIKIVAVDFGGADKEALKDKTFRFPDSVPFINELTGVPKLLASRDALMGLNTLKACEEANCDLIFYYAGNLHTQMQSVESGYWVDDQEEPVTYSVAPAGQVIALQTLTASIILTHQGGEMRNNSTGDKIETKVWKPSIYPFMTENNVPYCLGDDYYAYSVGKVSAAQ